MGQRFLGSGGSGYGYATSMWRTPQTTFNYQAEIYPMWLSAAVMPILGWHWRHCHEAPIVVVDESSPDEPDEVAGHEAGELLKSPNPDYGQVHLMNQVIASDVLFGNAYLHVITDRMNRPAQLYAIPHMEIAPRWSPDGTEFIAAYEHNVNGTSRIISARNVAHIRHGVDPANQRIGISPLYAAVRQIFGHNEAANAMAALMRNHGMPGIVLSPAAALARDGVSLSLTPEQKDDLRNMAEAKLTGESRGKPMVLTQPMDIATVGVDPDAMAFEQLFGVCVSTVCAQYGVDPMAFGFASANKTYSNMEEANKTLYHRVAMPFWDRVADALNDQVMRVWYPKDFASGLRYRFRTTGIKALQDDQHQQAKTLATAAGGPYLTVNEARKIGGHEAHESPEANELRKPMPKMPTDEDKKDSLKRGDES